MGVDKLFVEPGSPWENRYTESFNSRLRDELLDGELCLPIDEMKYVVGRWRTDYNHYRPPQQPGLYDSGSRSYTYRPAFPE